MKKLLTFLLISVSSVSAKIYVGAQSGYSFMNANLKAEGTDYDFVARKQYLFTKKFPLHTLNFGFLGGYEFDNFKVVIPLLEVDYAFSGKSKELTAVDYTEGNNFLNEENLKVKQNYSLGTMPGVNIKISDNFSALIGLRFSMTNYTITASHQVDGMIRALNYKSKKDFVFGVEPTLGGSYRFTDNVAMRLTAGYTIAKKVTFIPNYLNSQGSRDAGVSGAVSIRPRGFNLRAAIIFGF
ncbi:MAG TPA: hypothetical protein DIC42_06045 [Holosporales bacterium]|nr:hypothetical protein [Holosporales bacterium]